MRSLILAAGAALALCSCTTPVTAPAGGIEATANTLTLDATKGLTIATDAYTGVATLITAAVNQGVFSADQLRMIKTLNDQALKLINGADTSLTVAQRAAGIALIVTQLHSILGK